MLALGASLPTCMTKRVRMGSRDGYILIAGKLTNALFTEVLPLVWKGPVDFTVDK
jgi:hypothetical protein